VSAQRPARPENVTRRVMNPVARSRRKLRNLGTEGAAETYALTYTLSYCLNISDLKQSMLETHDVHSKLDWPATFVIEIPCRTPPKALFSLGKAISLEGGRKTANRETCVPGKNQNGEPGGSPFQRFYFRRRGAFQHLWRYAPRARCDGSSWCSKPGGLNLTSAAFRTTIPFYASAGRLASAPL
jgi:hypothetical protein